MDSSLEVGELGEAVLNENAGHTFSPTNFDHGAIIIVIRHRTSRSGVVPWRVIASEGMNRQGQEDSFILVLSRTIAGAPMKERDYSSSPLREIRHGIREGTTSEETIAGPPIRTEDPISMENEGRIQYPLLFELYMCLPAQKATHRLEEIQCA
jgi:hypothetical protein